MQVISHLLSLLVVSSFSSVHWALGQTTSTSKAGTIHFLLLLDQCSYLIDWRWVSPGQGQAKGRGSNAGTGTGVTVTLAQATLYSWSETSHSLGSSVIWEHQASAHPLFCKIFSPCFGKAFLIQLHIEANLENPKHVKITSLQNC